MTYQEPAIYSNESKLEEKQVQYPLFISSGKDSDGFLLYKKESKVINRSGMQLSKDFESLGNGSDVCQESIDVMKIVSVYDELQSIFISYDFKEHSSDRIRIGMLDFEKDIPFQEICSYLRSMVQSPSEPVNVKCAIADYLCNYDFDEVQPFAVDIVSNLLLSRSDIEIGYGLELADNFCSRELLPALEKCQPGSERLKWTLENVRSQLTEA